jgi:hypothetical protein
MTTPQPVDYATPSPPSLIPSKPARIVGWILSTLVILMMGVMPIVMLIFNPAMIAEGTKKYGYPEQSAIPIVIAEIVCALLFAIPRTAVLGAILISAYLGGAVATHVHAGELNFWIPPIFAIIAWIALLLREPRLRQLLPLRKTEPKA